MAQESILLTGATGNVGAVTLDQLLTTTSHTVNAVLRKASYIPLLEKKYPADVANKRLSFTIIPDMTLPGAFDAAAASSTAIIHIATPLATGNWVEEMIKPTWDIDRGVLEAANKSSQVKRVIICGTILQTLGFSDLFNSELVVSEASWNSVTFDEAKEGPFHTAYPYSKTDAEKKTWAWVQQNGSSIGFDVVMLLPSSILGRSPQVTFKPADDGPGGIPRVYNALMVEKSAAAVDANFPFVVDTDDVAHRHVLSLNRDKVPGNQRYLVTRAEPLNLRAVVARLRKEHPELAGRLPDLPVDDDAVATEKLCKVDLSKSNAVFGTQWRDVYESVAQIVFDVVEWEKKQGSK